MRKTTISDPAEFQSTPHDAPPITRNPFGRTPSATLSDIKDYVFKHAGCTKPVRDDDVSDSDCWKIENDRDYETKQDLRLFGDLEANRGPDLIDEPPNGIPQLPRGTPRPDQDNDGIPDSAESGLGRALAVADSAAIDAATGYAYIELWANSLELLGDEYIAPAVSSVTTRSTPKPTTTTTKAAVTPKPTTTPKPATTTTTTAVDPNLFTIAWRAAPIASDTTLRCTTPDQAKLALQVTYDTNVTYYSHCEWRRECLIAMYL
jgi:hypothetical protein